MSPWRLQTRPRTPSNDPEWHVRNNALSLRLTFITSDFWLGCTLIWIPNSVNTSEMKMPHFHLHFDSGLTDLFPRGSAATGPKCGESCSHVWVVCGGGGTVPPSHSMSVAGCHQSEHPNPRTPQQDPPLAPAASATSATRNHHSAPASHPFFLDFFPFSLSLSFSLLVMCVFMMES